MRGLPGFFYFDDRLTWLIDLGDQLEACGKTVDFEMFRSDLLLATSAPCHGICCAANG